MSADVDPDYAEGTELTYLHGVAVIEGTPVPTDLDVIEVPPGAWAVFRTSGPYPAALQSTWAATASDWFPSNPWRLRPGPSVVTILDGRIAQLTSAPQPPSYGCRSNAPNDERGNRQVGLQVHETRSQCRKRILDRGAVSRVSPPHRPI